MSALGAVVFAGSEAAGGFAGDDVGLVRGLGDGVDGVADEGDAVGGCVGVVVVVDL
jgi:hypothetical protein